jgi:antitoxin PrlF
MPGMIHSRITSKAQTTIPRAVREALRLEVGDDVAYEIDGDRVVLRRYDANDPFENPFVHFTEWASDADRVYDDLAVRFPAKPDHAA